jgi:TonB family protein
MQFLSLQEPDPLPARRLTQTEALVLSVALHLLLLLLFLYLPSHLPAPLVALLGARAVSADVAALQAEAEASEEAASRAARKEETRIPLKFVYVKVPNDVAVRENKDARLLSDKTRKARQEIPTPRYAKQFSLDPHSEGDTIDRVRPDPARPEGPESPEASVPQPSGGHGGESQDATEDLRPGGSGSGSGGEGASLGSGRETPTDASPGVGSASPRSRAGGGPDGPAGSPPAGEGEGSSAPSRDRLTKALTDLKAGEFKFTFNNPAFLRNGSYGTMSFDTQDFPWGDYARRLYLIIRNSWFERIPLAAREGIAGYVCQHFVISKDGRVLDITTVRPSSIPPFDKAAADAISASNPLPPLPPDFPHGQEGVTFCFFYNMYPGEID